MAINYISRLKDEQDERGEKLFEEWLQGEGECSFISRTRGIMERDPGGGFILYAGYRFLLATTGKSYVPREQGS